MIDASNLKAPGWQRVMAELLAPAPDDQAFLFRLVAVLARVSSARQAVLFAVDKDAEAAMAEPRPLLVWPPNEANPNELPAIEQPSDARAAARAAAEGSQIRVFAIENPSAYYGEAEKGYLVAAPIATQPAGEDAPPGGPRLVVTLSLEPLSKPALQTTLAMIEVLAGYTALHASRQQLRRARASTAALDLAARLISSVNGAKTFKGACFQLVNDLQRQVRADRVSMGWITAIGGSGSVRAVAISDTEQIDRRVAVVQKLEAAMDECLDQEQAVLYPPPPPRPAAQGGPPTAPEAALNTDPLLSQAITHAHRELAAKDARLKVVSVPMRDGDKVVGVITLESSAEAPADIGSIELVQAALDLVAPVMLIRESDGRPLYKRAYASAIRAGEWLVGPRHTAWKLAGLALFIAALVVTFYHTEYRVEATAEIQPRTRATISAPYDGVIAAVGEGIAPGKLVKAGDVLVTLDTTEILLRIYDASARMTQASKEADLALKAGNRQSEFQQAQARAAQAEANLKRAQRELEQATIRAPIDGTLIAGDLEDKLGAAVRLGDPLFQIAPLDDMLVIAKLSDRDIALVRDQFAEGGASAGLIATRAAPSVRHPFTIERIVPLAQAKDGKNTFEIRAKLDQPVPGLRPGMEGIAKFNVGRHSLWYIGTRRIRDQLRLWLWW